MAFVDELKIHMEAGRGGDGVVRWLHEKGKEYMGPAGGNGGKGGNIYVRGVSDLAKLSNYRHKKEFSAEKGGDGGSKSMHGRDGKDLILDVPVGTVITNLENNKEYEITEVDKPVLILKGGNGGLGNEYFKASTNIQPQESTPGKEGESAEINIELRITANIALVGLPNAGKSSLLNALTNAEAKVGDYEFTTLEPNLGAFYGTIIADIPGLIRGASEGKGLGHKFLRHIMRAETIFHCISVENEDLSVAYKTIRKEMEDFNKDLISKKEIVIVTKIDAVNEEAKVARISSLQSEFPSMKIFEISVYDDATLEPLKKKINELKK